MCRSTTNFMVKQESDKRNPRICPLFHEKFDHVSPALIIVAQIDAIRDDGRSKEKYKILADDIQILIYL